MLCGKRRPALWFYNRRLLVTCLPTKSYDDFRPALVRRLLKPLLRSRIVHSTLPCKFHPLFLTQLTYFQSGTVYHHPPNRALLHPRPLPPPHRHPAARHRHAPRHTKRGRRCRLGAHRVRGAAFGDERAGRGRYGLPPRDVRSLSACQPERIHRRLVRAFFFPQPAGGCLTRTWLRYSTGSNLNTYSALIQNFYSQETAPYPAIHIALNTGTELGEEAGVKAYVR